MLNVWSLNITQSPPAKLLVLAHFFTNFRDLFSQLNVYSTSIQLSHHHRADAAVFITVSPFVTSHITLHFLLWISSWGNPLNTCTAPQLVFLVVSFSALHLTGTDMHINGLPRNIISNRDVLFTSLFWGHLHKLIGTKLKMSSVYHPQMDGSMEHMNRTIGQMLWQCISPDQKDWVGKLPTIQFAINSARLESTGYAPFFLNNGRMPRAMVWNAPESMEYPNVQVFSQKKKLALISAHDM